MIQLSNERFLVASDTMYVLCELEKETSEGVQSMQTWVRKAIAIPGAVLDKLEDTETGVIRSGWKVVSAGGVARPENLLIKRAHNYDLPSGGRKRS